MTQTMQDTPQSIWRPEDSLALRVWMVRREIGLSQRQLALRCGLTYGEIQSLEGGAHIRDELRKIRLISRGTGADESWLRDGGPLASHEHFPEVLRGSTGRYFDDSLASSSVDDLANSQPIAA